MEFQDRTLNCAECGSAFTFTGEQQQYHQEKGYSEPRRCPTCRAARRATIGGPGGGGGGGGRGGGGGYGGGGGRGGGGGGGYGGGGGAGGDRQSFEATCAECGQKAMVPFRPNPERPVYCNECFRKHRQGR